MTDDFPTNGDLPPKKRRKRNKTIKYVEVAPHSEAHATADDVCARCLRPLNFPFDKRIAHMIEIIAQGAFPHVASAAAGMTPEEYTAVLYSGIHDKTQRAIRQATARARATAESVLHDSMPDRWLRHGPGKAGANVLNPEEGWSEPVPAAHANARIKSITEENTNDFLAKLLTTLEPFPEARIAVAKMLNETIDPVKSTLAALPAPE